MRTCFSLLTAVTIALCLPVWAQTYTESILYSFPENSSGLYQSPTTLVLDSAGNVYGTTLYGGPLNTTANCLYSNCGTIFKLNSKGVLTTLYSFKGGSDGYAPCCLVIDKSGNLFGTTSSGGLGYGTVFKFATTTNKFSTLHEFGRMANDGLNPTGPLTIDSAGNVYGVTSMGGANTGCSSNNCGVIFEVTPKGGESILHNFSSPTGPPQGNLLRDGQGNFYGVEGNGFDVYEVTSSGVESLLQSNLVGGAYTGYVARNAAGNFYAGFGYTINCNDSTDCIESGLSEVVGSDDGIADYYLTSLCEDGLCTTPAWPSGPFVLSGGKLYGTSNYWRLAKGLRFGLPI